jgi:hypothetical protein
MNNFNQFYNQVVNENLESSQIAEIFHKIITTQEFASWYTREFEDYVQGEENAPSREQIISKLQGLISRYMK